MMGPLVLRSTEFRENSYGTFSSGNMRMGELSFLVGDLGNALSSAISYLIELAKRLYRFVMDKISSLFSSSPVTSPVRVGEVIDPNPTVIPLEDFTPSSPPHEQDAAAAIMPALSTPAPAEPNSGVIIREIISDDEIYKDRDLFYLNLKKLKDEEKTKITTILGLLYPLVATDALARRKELERWGKELDETLHPLVFIAFVFSDPLLIAQFRSCKSRWDDRKKMYTGSIEKLQVRKTEILTQIRGFSFYMGIDPMEAERLIKIDKWEDLFKLMEGVARDPKTRYISKLKLLDKPPTVVIEQAVVPVALQPQSTGQDLDGATTSLPVAEIVASSSGDVQGEHSRAVEMLHGILERVSKMEIDPRKVLRHPLQTKREVQAIKEEWKKLYRFSSDEIISAIQDPSNLELIEAFSSNKVQFKMMGIMDDLSEALKSAAAGYSGIEQLSHKQWKKKIMDLLVARGVKINMILKI